MGLFDGLNFGGSTNSGTLAGSFNGGNTSGSTLNNTAGLALQYITATGGNLVSQVNSQYLPLFEQKQAAYEQVNSDFIAAQKQVTAFDATIADLQRQYDYWQSEVVVWQARHKGCGPFSKYGCKEVDNNVSRNEQQRDGVGATINQNKDNRQAVVNRINNEINPRLTLANKDLQDTKNQYNLDVQAAVKAEQAQLTASSNYAAAQVQNQNQLNPEYWRVKNEQDLKNAQLAQQAAASAAQSAIENAKLNSESEIKKAEMKQKETLTTIGIYAGAAILIAVIVVIGLKMLRN